MASPTDSTLRTRATEFVVIVFSILSAFALDSVWAQRTERRALQLELGSVREEMEGNREHLANWLLLHRRISSSIDELLALLSAGKDGTQILVPDTLLLGARIGPTVNPSAGALRVLISSGRLALVEDIELRLALAGWEDALADVSEGEEVGYGMLVDDILPYLSHSLPPDEFDALNRLNSYFWTDPFRGEALPVRMIPVPWSADLRNLLSMRRSFADVAIIELAAFLASVDRTLELLTRSLE